MNFAVVLSSLDKLLSAVIINSAARRGHYAVKAEINKVNNFLSAPEILIEEYRLKNLTVCRAAGVLNGLYKQFGI